MEESGDVSIGGRTGRVGVDEVETAGSEDDGIKSLAVDFSSNAGGLGCGEPNGYPGEKDCTLGLSVLVGSCSCFSAEAEALAVGGVAPAPKPECD